MRSLSSRREQYVSGVADKIPAAQNIKLSTSNSAERPGVLRADPQLRKLYDVLAADAASLPLQRPCRHAPLGSVARVASALRNHGFFCPRLRSVLLELRWRDCVP
jgi:hypothetical protein